MSPYETPQHNHSHQSLYDSDWPREWSFVITYMKIQQHFPLETRHTTVGHPWVPGHQPAASPPCSNSSTSFSTSDLQRPRLHLDQNTSYTARKLSFSTFQFHQSPLDWKHTFKVISSPTHEPPKHHTPSIHTEMTWAILQKGLCNRRRLAPFPDVNLPV